MCGRFRLVEPKWAFSQVALTPTFDFRPRYNIAPTQKIPVVSALDKLEEMRWGIVPQWAGAKSSILINARSESVREKRSFKRLFAERRCLVLADGFYEWTKTKRPHLFKLQDNQPFTIGAFYDTGEENRCCLLTTAPNEIMLPVHDRMPVIIRKEDWAQWLELGDLDDQTFTRLTSPYATKEMQPALEVSKLVNSAKTDGAECCEPLQPMLNF